MRARPRRASRVPEAARHGASPAVSVNVVRLWFSPRCDALEKQSSGGGPFGGLLGSSPDAGFCDK